MPCANCSRDKIKAKRLLRRIAYGLVIFLLFSHCGKNQLADNPYLIKPSFRVTINLNLPQYAPLLFAGGVLLINQGGINGLILFNVNGEQYYAWEATCSNHELRACSTLTIDGMLVHCACEDFTYSLSTGLPFNSTENNTESYPLLFYQVEKLGDFLSVSN